MNCDCKLFQEYSQDNYLVMFRESIATRTMKPSDYDFILGPINSEAKLKLNPDPETNEIPFSIPKIILNLTMEKLGVGLTKSQYQDIMQLIEQFGRMSRAYPYRKFRPHGITYRGHYKVKKNNKIKMKCHFFILTNLRDFFYFLNVYLQSTYLYNKIHNFIFYFAILT